MQVEVKTPKKYFLSQKYLDKLDRLDFQVLDNNSPLSIVEQINQAEVTPFDTGYTQSKNAIEKHRGEKWLVNNNKEYGEVIYNGDNINFKKKKNKNAQSHWLEVDEDDLIKTVKDFINQEILLDLDGNGGA